MIELVEVATDSPQVHHQLQSVLSSITDGLAVLDKNWRYTYFSEQGARIIGMCPEQLLGRMRLGYVSARSGHEVL